MNSRKEEGGRGERLDATLLSFVESIDDKKQYNYENIKSTEAFVEVGNITGLAWPGPAYYLRHFQSFHRI